MVDRVNNILKDLDPSLRTSSSAPASDTQTMGQDGFLKLMLAQIQNQDPLEPQDASEFTSQLSQFSGVEQAVKTNTLLEKLVSQSSDFSSLSGYLGNTVRMDASSVEVENGNAGKFSFDLRDSTSSLKIEFLDDSGNVKGEKVFTDLKAGVNNIDIDNLSINSGNFSVKATAINKSGITSEPTLFKAGLVSGYVPGASPTLIVDGKEISPGEILQVTMG